MSFACYCMPSAADLPRFDVQHTLTPSPKNPLGAKGLGESGTTGSVAAVHNAVLDALAPLGVTELDPPFLPGRVWAAIQAARHRNAESTGPVQPAAADRPAIADLDLGEVRSVRRHLDPVGHYHRPDIFRLYVDTSPRPAVVEISAPRDEPVLQQDKHAARTVGTEGE
jgi:hypothetical protein